MQEIVEFRIPEENARDFLNPGEGVSLGGSVRKLVLPRSDPLATKIGAIQREFRAAGRSFFLGWDLHRRYGVDELQSARAFRVLIKRTFEPTGEECGTLYDDARACQYCGSGGQRVSELVLDGRSLPKSSGLGIAKTIAGEIVVSDGLVEVFRTNELRGAEFRPIGRHRKPAIPLPGWHELVVISGPLNIVAPTHAGLNPFDDPVEPAISQATVLEDLGIQGSWCDREGRYRCPLGHTIGLNLLSELSVDAKGFRDCDIAMTEQLVGVRRGFLRPEPLLVVSPRLRQLVLRHGIKGMDFEVVYLRNLEKANPEMGTRA